MMKISIKILGVNFGNSILDNSKWDKISDNIAKKIHIWNRGRLSFKGVIVNQTLLSKLWYIGQICTIPKYTKKEYTGTISCGTGKKHDLPEAWFNSPFRRVDQVF